MKFETIIGLEVHVQLRTKSKIFCSCSTQFGNEPNTNTCPVCLGLPGTLPVLNEEALALGIKTGLALECNIAERLKFDRKNYFYPDLPKAYQITQFDMPVAAGGCIMIMTEEGEKRIGITRAHLEEDAGKSVHDRTPDGTCVDYNRTGTPLLEIVSEPEMRSPEEAYAYLTNLKAILEYIDVSDCNMEEGSLRCDANVSIRPLGQEEFGTRVEIKNLNSFKMVQRAIAYEVKRQIEATEDEEAIVQQTRLWNDAKQVTMPMRSKEEAHDYRYFPEPDLVPFTISRERVEAVRAALPELPQEKKARFIKEYGLSEYDASILVQEQPMAVFFEASVSAGADAKQAVNWMQGELLALMKDSDVTWQTLKVTPVHISEIITMISKGEISQKIGKTVLADVFISAGSPQTIVEEKGLKQVSDTGEIKTIAEKIVANNPQSVADYKSGNVKAISFFVGQLMKQTKGKANPQVANQIFSELLK